ncbi:hypothetical protein HMPREF1210_03347 [Paenisporosarcina sp. HGH0030]|uniref:hypothetical protein n=1 Tax=Paenisporosarcina sp. HGH0030 TaxID=1078085 RepID=UPI00034ECC9D|nr:hypothetical protein [Paenisporosarcina sp. HGH0030]EPD49448.1 hypothetical protein HMPREF1210_03347 [Paenisporosarcina sp. HGH0030]
MKTFKNKIIILIMSIVIFVIFYQLLGFFAGNLLPTSPLGTMIGLIILFLLIPISYLSAYGVVKVIKDM